MDTEGASIVGQKSGGQELEFPAPLYYLPSGEWYNLQELTVLKKGWGSRKSPSLILRRLEGVVGWGSILGKKEQTGFQLSGRTIAKDYGRAFDPDSPFKQKQGVPAGGKTFERRRGMKESWEKVLLGNADKPGSMWGIHKKQKTPRKERFPREMNGADVISGYFVRRGGAPPCCLSHGPSHLQPNERGKKGLLRSPGIAK